MNSIVNFMSEEKMRNFVTLFVITAPLKGSHISFLYVFFWTSLTFAFILGIELDILASSTSNRMNKILSILYFCVGVKIFNLGFIFY